MRHKGRCIFFFLLFLFLFGTEVHASQETENMLEEQLSVLSTQQADDLTEQEGVGTLSQWTKDILTGEANLSWQEAKEWFFDACFGEITQQIGLLLQILLLAVFSALLRLFSDSFEAKTVGEMGFYVCYMVLVMMLMRSFYEIAAMVGERIGLIVDAFMAMLPVFVTLVASAGEFGRAALMGPTIMGGSALLSFFAEWVILPLTIACVSLEMVNHMTQKPMLQQFARLVREGIAKGMKIAAYAFLFLLTIQKIGGGALGALAVKTAKIAVGSVPIVGDVMSGAVDTASAVAGTLRNGILTAAAVILLLLCLPMVLKLVVLLGIFRLGAVLSEPFCEKRLIDCMNTAADYTALLIGLVFLTEGMFLFSSLLLLAVL